MGARLAAAPAGARADGKLPPPRWWILAVTVPCLLTLPVSGFLVLQALMVVEMGCFDSCPDPSYLTQIETVATIEFFFGVAAIVIAWTGLARPSWRRVLAGVSWIVCLLAYLGLLVR